MAEVKKDKKVNKIQVTVKTHAFVEGRRVYPGQKVLIPENKFHKNVFEKVEAKKEPEGEVKAPKDKEPAPGEAEAKKENKQVI